MRARTVTADILAVLAIVPKATATKLSEDCGCHVTSVYPALRVLMDRGLVEEGGRLDNGRKPMTYRLHPRLRWMYEDET